MYDRRFNYCFLPFEGLWVCIAGTALVIAEEVMFWVSGYRELVWGIDTHID